MISFLLNQTRIDIENAPTDMTVLRYLRETQGLCATKEGCASGDCGACVVVLAEYDQSHQKMRYSPLNSCIALLSSVHKKQVITTEHLAHNGKLHPVQQAMVNNHASQCGFCTPGFVMSMFALFHAKQSPDRAEIEKALSGNLCRCTGYRPIIDAAREACSKDKKDQFMDFESETAAKLAQIPSGESGIPGLHMPQCREQLAELISQFPEARLAAGCTDLALEITQQHKQFPNVISLRDVVELNVLEETETEVVIGAGVPLSIAEPLLLKHFPPLTELITRFASLPLRNQATMGGNLANASPIGDLPPALFALNAELVIDNGQQRRKEPILNFFKGYKKTTLKPDEWIESICIPKLSTGALLRAYKVSKRIEDDISAVCAAFHLHLEDGKVIALHNGFGGMAATPLAISALEDALLGKEWHCERTLVDGMAVLQTAFQPIDDVRATANYRITVASNLFKRFWLETRRHHQIVETRVVSHA